MNYELPVMIKGKVVKSTILIALMLTALYMMPLALAESETVQNITVDTAYSMIRRNRSFPDLVILDVRNQSEYDINHLYGAVSVPLHELEARIGELDEYVHNEIIVYCGSGGRSEIASGILAEYGFTKVYNMIGGITAWIEAGYTVYTTFHNVTVDTTSRRGINVEIKPLLLQMGCTSCNENQECPSESEITNVQITVLEEEEDYTVTLVTYELNGTLFEFTITKSLLWSYSDQTHRASKTANFTLTEITTEDTSVQFYSLNYVVQHMEYNLTISTNLTPLNSETYNSSFTVVNYTPVGKSGILSLEFVEFNSSVTLSQLYTSLDKVAKKIGQVYIIDGLRNDDATLVQLGQNYYKMATETNGLSRLVKLQLQQYDKEIINNSAILMDPEPECTLCQLACPLLVVGCWAVCWLFPVVCYYCATLTYYYIYLEFSAYLACTLVGFCP